MKNKAIIREVGILASIVLTSFFFWRMGNLDLIALSVVPSISMKYSSALLFSFQVLLLIFLIYLPRRIFSRFDDNAPKIILLVSNALLIIVNTLLLRSLGRMELIGSYTTYPPLSVLPQEQVPSANNINILLADALCIAQVVFVMVIVLLVVLPKKT
jgi:hypothetical protein